MKKTTNNVSDVSVKRLNGIKDVFNLPDNIIPVSMAVIGYPNENPEQPKRYKKERVHINKW